MKKFTIKDLIRYNNPCKSCGRVAEFYLRSYQNGESIGSSIRPQINPIDKKVHFTLQSRYKDRLIMVLNVLTNEIVIQSNADDAQKSFEEFQALNRVVAETECKNCRTLIWTEDLKFEDGVIRPVKLFHENVHVIASDYKYTIITNHSTKKSSVIVDILNQVTPISPLRLELPALPLYKFKTREELLNRLKLLVTFS